MDFSSVSRFPHPVPPGGLTLSLAHLRWSQGQSGQTVLDGPLITATMGADTGATSAFLASLAAISLHL